MVTKVAYLANVANIARSTQLQKQQWLQIFDTSQTLQKEHDIHSCRSSNGDACSIHFKRCKRSIKYTVADVALATKVAYIANVAEVAQCTQFHK